MKFPTYASLKSSPETFQMINNDSYISSTCVGEVQENGNSLTSLSHGFVRENLTFLHANNKAQTSLRIGAV